MSRSASAMPSHLIVGPTNRVTPCSAKDISDRVALGRWAAPEFNKLLGRPGFDLIQEDEAGRIVLRASEGMSPQYAAAAFTEFAALLKGPDPPRFGVGALGSVWVDLTLAGKEVRLALEPSQAKAHNRWGILIILLE